MLEKLEAESIELCLQFILCYLAGCVVGVGDGDGVGAGAFFFANAKSALTTIINNARKIVRNFFTLFHLLIGI